MNLLIINLPLPFQFNFKLYFVGTSVSYLFPISYTQLPSSIRLFFPYNFTEVCSFISLKLPHNGCYNIFITLLTLTTIG
ncbi:MAG: hypothetical protein ACTS42_02155 [Candidatus Hodgkinia cicadicola]